MVRTDIEQLTKTLTQSNTTETREGGETVVTGLSYCYSVISLLQTNL